MSGGFSFDEDSHRFLHSHRERYPYAFGYLAGQVRLYLDGHTSRERLQAVLDALKTELRGEQP